MKITITLMTVASLTLLAVPAFAAWKCKAGSMTVSSFNPPKGAGTASVTVSNGNGFATATLKKRSAKKWVGATDGHAVPVVCTKR